jgi:hypothetical protein
MRYQAFLTLSLLSLVACSGEPVGVDGKALHSADPSSAGAKVDQQSSADLGVNQAGTGAGGSGGPTHTGSAGSGGPVQTGSGGSGGPTDTGSAGSGGPTNTGSAGSGGPTNTGSAGSAPDPTTAPEAAACGNGFCEPGETFASCAADCCELTEAGACVAVCGNGFCEDGEDATCESDCD